MAAFRELGFLAQVDSLRFSLCMWVLTAAALAVRWFSVWEPLEARAAAGELVAGTEDKLEVGP